MPAVFIFIFQSVFTFLNTLSIWSEKVYILHQRIENYPEELDKKYDIEHEKKHDLTKLGIVKQGTFFWYGDNRTLRDLFRYCSDDEVCFVLLHLKEYQVVDLLDAYKRVSFKIKKKTHFKVLQMVDDYFRIADKPNHKLIDFIKEKTSFWCSFILRYNKIPRKYYSFTNENIYIILGANRPEALGIRNMIYKYSHKQSALDIDW